MTIPSPLVTLVPKGRGQSDKDAYQWFRWWERKNRRALERVLLQTMADIIAFGHATSVDYAAVNEPPVTSRSTEPPMRR